MRRMRALQRRSREAAENAKHQPEREACLSREPLRVRRSNSALLVFYQTRPVNAKATARKDDLGDVPTISHRTVRYTANFRLIHLRRVWRRSGP